jgi:hypothetical protein
MSGAFVRAGGTTPCPHRRVGDCAFPRWGQNVVPGGLYRFTGRSGQCAAGPAVVFVFGGFAVGAAEESLRRCDALRGRSVGVVCREIGRSVWCFVRLACRRGVAWRWIGVAWRGAVALDEAARSVAWCCAAARSVPCLEIGHSNDRSQGKGPMSVVVPVQETDLISVAGARDRCRWSRWCDGPISPVRPMQRTDVGGGARARDRRRQRGWCKGPMSVVGGSAGGRSRRCHRATDRSRQCR